MNSLRINQAERRGCCFAGQLSRKKKGRGGGGHRPHSNNLSVREV
jgi:hypothetical protein